MDNRHKGPSDKQEQILLLDRFEEWLGRSKPTLVGKSGIVDSGEKKLADILAAVTVGWPDSHVHELICEGALPMGEQPKFGIFRSKARVATLAFEELLKFPSVH